MPLTAIVVTDAPPGLRMPATARLPLTVPADPKVAPDRTAIWVALIVEPARPRSRPPVRSTAPSAAVPETVAKPDESANASIPAMSVKATGVAALPPDIAIMSVPAPPSTAPAKFPAIVNR